MTAYKITSATSNYSAGPAFGPVTTTAADSLTSALVPLFRADRLIGSQIFTASDLKADTLRLAASNQGLAIEVPGAQ